MHGDKGIVVFLRQEGQGSTQTEATLCRHCLHWAEQKGVVNVRLACFLLFGYQILVKCCMIGIREGMPGKDLFLGDCTFCVGNSIASTKFL
jgi:hypothetical protein